MLIRIPPSDSILDTTIVGGVLGPIKAYFGTVESQGRGSLHLHLLICLDHDLKPTDMEEKTQSIFGRHYQRRLRSFQEQRLFREF